MSGLNNHGAAILGMNAFGMINNGFSSTSSSATNNQDTTTTTMADDSINHTNHINNDQQEPASPTASSSLSSPSSSPSSTRPHRLVTATTLTSTASLPPAPAPVPSSSNNRPMTTHLNVSCDECGEMPIIGTRYKSTIQPNYDVCRHCLEENHQGRDENEFTALETYGAATTEPSTGRSVAVHSLHDLQGLIENDPTVEDLAFYVGTLTSPSLGQTVRRVLANHPSIKSVHIHIFGTENATETIQCLAEGLQHNQSVLSVSWNILSNRGQRGLSDEAATSLQTLMESNKTIKYMFFQRQRGFGYTTPGNGRDDTLADKVFDALSKTHLHTVRFSGHTPVSNTNKSKAWAAMMSNPYLKRIKATFDSPDYQLDLLQADKKHKWMERWTSVDYIGDSSGRHDHDDEAKEEEEDSKDNDCDDCAGSDTNRWKVLKEVLDSDFVDKVPLLYHFLRQAPTSLLSLDWPQEEEGCFQKGGGQEDLEVEEEEKNDDNNEVMMMDVEYDQTAWA